LFSEGKKKIKPIILEVNETNRELIQQYMDSGAHIYDTPGESLVNYNSNELNNKNGQF
jgi:hypothetical protein